LVNRVATSFACLFSPLVVGPAPKLLPFQKFGVSISGSFFGRAGFPFIFPFLRRFSFLPSHPSLLASLLLSALHARQQTHGIESPPLSYPTFKSPLYGRSSHPFPLASSSYPSTLPSLILILESGRSASEAYRTPIRPGVNPEDDSKLDKAYVSEFTALLPLRHLFPLLPAVRGFPLLIPVAFSGR